LVLFGKHSSGCSEPRSARLGVNAVAARSGRPAGKADAAEGRGGMPRLGARALIGQLVLLSSTECGFFGLTGW
jgi:hypothetical protein